MVDTPRPPGARLKIAVVGAGKVGSAFAYRLALADHALTVVARPGSSRLRQLRRDGGVVLDSGERAAMRVDEVLDETVAYDLVVVTTLAHQLDALLPALSRSRAARLHVMSVNFDVETVAHALGADRCSFGMPFIMAWLDDQGRLKTTVSRQRKTLHGDRRVAQVFDAAGIPSAFEPEMALWLRCHTPVTIGFESIAVSAQRRGAGASWAEARVVARGVRGGLRIVKAMEGRLHPRSKSVLASCPPVLFAAMLHLLSRVASFRILLASGVAEARALTDVLTAAARARGLSSTLVDEVLAMKPPQG